VTWTETQLLLAGLAMVGAFLTSAWVNAISRISRPRAVRLAEEHPKAGSYLVKIAESPSKYLTGVLVVMLILRVTATVLITATILRFGMPAPEVVSIAIMTFVLFQVAEIAPRTWVLERLDKVLLSAARPAFWIGRMLGPLTAILVNASRVFLLILPGRGLPKGPLMSEEEIKSMLDLAESEDVIEAEEREMLRSIFEFTDTVVREVMVPRPDMVCADASATLEEVLGLHLKHGYSRIPVIDGSIDNVMGIVYLKDVIRRLHGTNGGRSRSTKRAGDIKREASFVPESKKVAELLREMQKAKTHMVIVVDEYGGVAGLATLEDLLEEIVGEISDEYDREEPSVVWVDDQTLRVAARVSIEELNELLGVGLPHSEWDSVGGLVGGLLGRLPQQGDVVTHDGIEFEVQDMQGRRIAHVLVRGESVRKPASLAERR
jgi:CBS domain containing-hemolysin-like protein